MRRADAGTPHPGQMVIARKLSWLVPADRRSLALEFEIGARGAVDQQPDRGLTSSSPSR
jgi:hypothetical protein